MRRIGRFSLLGISFWAAASLVVAVIVVQSFSDLSGLEDFAYDTVVILGLLYVSGGIIRYMEMNFGSNKGKPFPREQLRFMVKYYTGLFICMLAVQIADLTGHDTLSLIIGIGVPVVAIGWLMLREWLWARREARSDAVVDDD
jgi:hypothetical protein